MNRDLIGSGVAEIAFQPHRYKILKHLSKSTEPQFVDQIAEATGIHPRLVSHHMDILEQYKLAKSEYGTMKAKDARKRMITVRFCEITKHCTETLHAVKQEVVDNW